MSNDAFDGQILAEKLSKLNNSQQSIESLSRWCISHRKKARQIVETWHKLFNSRQREQRVSFLYLANDILQNSRRKGSEFVNEFWKVLPVALKHVYDNGDEYGKKAVTRLVDIWEERKVFGSRAQGLKDEILGKNSPPPVASNGKSSSAIKIVKRDAHSVRIKLAIGGLPEKILTAFQSVLDEHLNEEAALNTCNAALCHMGKIREEAENVTPGNQHGSTLVNELQELENVLQQCVGQLETAEATRSILVSQLKEALQDQESKLELIHAQLQVARGQIEQASSLRKRLISDVRGSSTGTTTILVAEASRVTENNLPPVQPTSSSPLHPLAQPVVSFAPLKTTDEESKKAAAAAVAAKLAASTSSAQMLTSVLSSLVAEEVASMNSSLKFFPAEKRQKLDKPMPASEISNSDASNAAYFTSLQQQPGTGVPLIPVSTSMQPISQPSQLQSSFGALPPLPPPPSLPPANAVANQYVQSAGKMTGVMPYGYGPLPPALPPPNAMGFQTLQQSPPQQQPQQQQSSATGGYYRPPGIGFYGQNHQATPPPVPRQ